MKFLVTDIEFDGLDEVGDGIPEFQLSEKEVSTTHRRKDMDLL